MSGYFLVRRKDFSKIKPQLDGKGFKILLEIIAHLRAPEVKEVPYTFRPRAHGESKLSSKVIVQYFQQVWRLCSSSRHLHVRFMKSAIVGGIGVLINLAVMAILIKFTSIHNWKASALACLAANLQNYVLYNVWTHVAGFERGFRKLEGYFSYVVMAAPGLVVTTASYAAIMWLLLHRALLQHGPQAFYPRLACQFLAVILGIRFNYALNSIFHWPNLSLLHLEVPAKAPILR
jgi:dolichol-phosphate mannosyltransferase